MGLKSFLSQIKNIFDYSPATIYIKDESLRYHYVNSHCLTHLRMTEADYFLLNDHETFCSAYANDYQSHDLAALQGDVFHQIDCISSKNGEHLFGITHKIPIKDENQKSIGVLGYSQYLNNQQLLNILSSSQFNENGSLKITTQAQKMLGLKYNEYGLTPRESACYFYLLQGISAKATAKKLAISPKTVEYYLANIKIKLDCSSKAELIEKGFELGLINIVQEKHYFTSLSPQTSLIAPFAAPVTSQKVRETSSRTK